jgi:hypothetical protein
MIRSAIALLFLALAFLSAAFADFINLDDLPQAQAPQSLERAKLASVSIGGCMGTFISNDGYMMTALHCVTAFPIFEDVPEKEFQTDLLRTDPAKLRLHPTIAGQIGAPTQPARAGQALEKARIVAAGKGFFSTSLDNFADFKKDSRKYQSLMAAGYGIPQDWAILKVERTNAVCVKTNPSALLPGQSVWSVNFSTREKGSAKDGRSLQFFSSGRVTRGIQDSSAFESWSQTQSSQRAVALYQSVMNRPGSYASTVDAIPGSSGSGLLNADGELVGVISDAEWLGQDGYAYPVTGSTQGATLQSILPQIQEQLSAQEFAEVFNCADLTPGSSTQLAESEPQLQP